MKYKNIKGKITDGQSMKSIKMLLGLILAAVIFFTPTQASALTISDGIISDITFETFYVDDGEYAVITATNIFGRVAWTYTTPTYPLAQLSVVQEVGLYNDTYYFLENGTVVALNIYTANTMWTNDSFGGASALSVIGPDGTIYLSGYLGPDFCAIDANGNTLARIPSVDDYYYWPCEMTLENNMIRLVFTEGISGTDGPPTYLIDTTTFQYFKETTVDNGSLPFLDVSVNDWYYDSVKRISEKGIMTGLSSNIFGPAAPLSRAQFAVILHRMNGAPDVSYTNRFPDIPADTWYTDAVLWASDIGVITGYASGYYGPADYITREQIATMLYRYAQYKGYNTSGRNLALAYTFLDGGHVSAFSKTAMEWITWSNIITGKDNNTRLDPQGNASRAECATMILRFEDYVVHPEQDDQYYYVSLGGRKLQIPFIDYTLKDVVIQHGNGYLAFYCPVNLEATGGADGRLMTLMVSSVQGDETRGCYAYVYEDGLYYNFYAPTDVQADMDHTAEYAALQRLVQRSVGSFEFAD